MILGEKIEAAISKSGIQLEAVAAHADMSVATLRRIFKKDSIDTYYLIKLSQLLNLPISYFFEEKAYYSVSQVGSGNAGRDIKKQKNISGAAATENAGDLPNTSDLQAKLQVCEAEKAGLEKLLAAKEEIIEVLKGRG